MTTTNKTSLIYGPFSYFSGKVAEKEIKLVDVSNTLKFYIERRALKKGLKVSACSHKWRQS